MLSHQLNTLLALALTTSTTLALTFTSPFAGSTVDLTSAFVVNWIPSPNDPSTFTLNLINTQGGSSDAPQILASGVRTSSGSYTVPANTIAYYGDGFELQATNGDGGASIGSSGEFSLAMGVYNLQTATNGVLTIATTATLGSGATATAATTGGAAESNTVTVAASSSSGASEATAAATTLASSVTSTQSASKTTDAATTSSTSGGSGGNLGFGNAGNANGISGGLVVSCAAVLGALAILVY